MGKKISIEVEKLCSSIGGLIEEFEERKRVGMGTVDLERTQQWFLEAVKSGSFGLYEKVVLMMESSIAHFEEAKKKLGVVLVSS